MTTAADAHRVYRLDANLRAAIKAARIETGLSVKEYWARAIEDQLPRIMEGLAAVGVEPTKMEGPVKVPMSAETLVSLYNAPVDTGVSQLQLAQAAVILAAREQVSKKPAKRASRKATSRKSTRRKGVTARK